jgi:hypothetical protein
LIIFNLLPGLKTDIKEIMLTIEKELHALHAIGAEHKKLEQASATNKPQSEHAGMHLLLYLDIN